MVSGVPPLQYPNTSTASHMCLLGLFGPHSTNFLGLLGITCPWDSAVLSHLPPGHRQHARAGSSHLLDDSFVGTVVLAQEDPTGKLGRVY